ncbi:hypothetical protein AALP_AA4G014600 [Arabis alpina]|uniref:Uncharacterized protein n=1 Tax=Arabis alpina TaxID=50452 RepID=A0A087H0G6_ARAAL|nr:hypothetical protein AALP_AA4G014600 [Arabis alpina]
MSILERGQSLSRCLKRNQDEIAEGELLIVCEDQ